MNSQAKSRLQLE